MKVVCVLNHEPHCEFTREHVARLAACVHANRDCEFVCISNLPIDLPGVEWLQQQHTWPGWWSMMEMYRVPGPAVYFDLDTVVIGDLAPLADAVDRLDEREMLMLKPPHNRYFETGICGWRGDVSWIYRLFRERASSGGMFTGYRMAGGLRRPLPFRDGKHKWDTEAHWTTAQLKAEEWKISALQGKLPGFAESYKNDLKGGKRKPSGSIVYFHGKPRPWDLETVPGWMPQLTAPAYETAGDAWRFATTTNQVAGFASAGCEECKT